MKNLLALALFLFSTVCVPQFAAADGRARLSDDSYLRKLSLHLRGHKPQVSEYDELRTLSTAADKERFFDRKISEYLASDDHAEKMVFRLSELFEIRTPNIPMTVPDAMASFDFRRDSLADIFSRIAHENRSWDELLTSKSYVVTNPGDYIYFKPLVPALDVLLRQSNEAFSPTPLKALPLSFEPDDARVAGSLTTLRFSNRYNTTNVNKNRRRAAAVFRIFLCDPMSPVIPAVKDKKSAALGDAFGEVDHNHVTEDQLNDGMTVSDSARHGALTQCAACHYKLDPMGKTFQNIGLVLNPEPAPGALVFNRAGGGQVNVPVSGVGELGQAIAQTPEYAQCQVEWFWKEFIGEDVVLYPNRKSALVQEFDRGGHRVNDFIHALVKSPEFRERPEKTEQITLPQVAPLLNRCDSCHSSEGYIATFADGQNSQRELADMERRLNLSDDKKDKMPRDWPRWNVKDIALLKKWLAGGALDEKGQPMLSHQGGAK